MDIDPLVARINELARKHKSVGLSEEEKQERDQLRRKYLERFKKSLRAQLDSITVVDKGKLH